MRTDQQFSPLLERRRQRVLDATVELLRDQGFDVSMDDVAEAAGIGRRTLFRYFETRSELMAAAVAQMYDRHSYRSYEDLIDPTDLDATLLAVFREAYRTSEQSGEALWHLAREDHATDDLADAAGRRRRIRRNGTARLADAIWVSAGGPRRCPAHVTQLFALLESAFAYHGWRLDSQLSTEQMARTAAQSVAAAMRAALPRP